MQASEPAIRELPPVRHWYPRATTRGRPHALWYFGWAAYVNRGGYLRALAVGGPVAAALAVAGVVLRSRPLLAAAAVVVAAGAAVFAFSLAGIYRMYGPPAARYIRRLLRMGGIDGHGGAVIADLHIGTWRISHLLGELLPRATIWSVNCWDAAGPPSEANVRQLHELEPEPASPRFATRAVAGGAIPLPDGSCDAVVLGFGIHEIPAGGPREKLFDEARRLLRPGGKLLLFEHLVDLENFVIFGPGIDHWPRRGDWMRLLAPRFATITHERAAQAVDLYVGAA